MLAAAVLAISCLDGAALQPKAPLVGANVDVGVLLTGQPNYLSTSAGDLFDIAHAAGLNAFRLTEWETWAPGERDTAYTAADWATIGKRAVATGISLVPVVELSAPDRRAIAQESDPAARTREYIAREERAIDVILRDGGLANGGAIAALDLGNEPELGAATFQIARSVGAYVHERYPNVPVTVGGWKVALGTPGARPWRWNAAGDGAPLLPFEDFVEPHVYNATLPGPTPGGGTLRALADEPPASVTTEVTQYLVTLQGWSANEPILIGEFGMANGFGARSHLAPSTVANPEIQSAHVAAFLAGVRAARDRGVDVAGALIWILAPRGGPERSQTEDNAWTLILRQGHAKPLRILPGLVALCGAFGASCEGARALVRDPPIER